MSVLSPERIEWHLWNWERWMHFCRLPGQMPKVASSGARYTSTDWDSSLDYDELDRRLGESTAAAIDGLDARLRTAVLVEHGIMAKAYRRPDHAAAYGQACAALGAALHRRGLV
jgi:hypothetical protein